MREPKIENPTVEEQREYASIRDNDATIVGIAGTKKKYKIRWLKNGQIEKLSRLLIRKGDTDEKDGEKDNALDTIVEDSKLSCKVAAVYILDGYWKLKFRYWFLWRWFYYIRQYGSDQLMDILEEGKKKVPLIAFLQAIMSMTEVRGMVMTMRKEEAEHILREQALAQQRETEKQGSGS